MDGSQSRGGRGSNLINKLLAHFLTIDWISLFYAKPIDNFLIEMYSLSFQVEWPEETHRVSQRDRRANNQLPAEEEEEEELEDEQEKLI